MKKFLCKLDDTQKVQQRGQCRARRDKGNEPRSRLSSVVSGADDNPVAKHRITRVSSDEEFSRSRFWAPSRKTNRSRRSTLPSSSPAEIASPASNAVDAKVALSCALRTVEALVNADDRRQLAARSTTAARARPKTATRWACTAQQMSRPHM